MADTVLTRTQAEDAIYSAVCACLGLDESSALAQRRVRRAWPSAEEQGAQPGFARTENVCFLRVSPADEPYSAFAETQSAYDAAADALRQTQSRCDALSVLLVFYGPAAFDDARRTRDGLASEEIRRVLRRKNLYPVRPPAAPRRVPELSGGRWWERCDLTLTLYERTERQYTTGYIAQADVTSKGD